MEILSQTEMMKYLLKIMADHAEFSRRQVKAEVCMRLNPRLDEQAQKTSNGAR